MNTLTHSSTVYTRRVTKILRSLVDIDQHAIRGANNSIGPAHIMNRREYMLKTMHGLPIPKSTKHALELNQVNQNQQWKDAMAKEICTMEDFEVFKQVDSSENFTRAKNWQFSPLHWAFAIKHDLRHKGGLLIGLQVTNADDLNKYATTTSLDGVKLQL